MWNLEQRKGQAFGIQGYEVPKQILHPMSLPFTKKKQSLGPTFDAKAAAKQPIGRDFFKNILRNSAPYPGPWAYHKEPTWITGFSGKPTNPVASHPLQNMQMKWEGVKKGSRGYQKMSKNDEKNKYDPKNLVSCKSNNCLAFKEYLYRPDPKISLQERISYSRTLELLFGRGGYQEVQEIASEQGNFQRDGR